jgi:hypothetical protein
LATRYPKYINVVSTSRPVITNRIVIILFEDIDSVFLILPLN